MKRASLFAVGALCAAPLLGQGVKELDKAWIRAARAGDAEAISRLYALDASAFLPAQMQAKGREAIRDSFRRFFSDYVVKDMTMSYDHYQTAGNLSTAAGRYTLTVQAKAGGGAESMQGRFTSIAARRGGRWVYLVDHASMPVPPAGEK